MKFIFADKTPNSDSGEDILLSFFYPCEPPRTTYQSTRKLIYVQGRALFADDKKAKQIRYFFSKILQDNVPKEPIAEPIELKISYFYPRKKMSKKDTALCDKFEDNRMFLACEKRPDIDNIAKMLLDVMTRIGFFVDDSIITKIEIIKCYSREPGIFIEASKVIDSDDPKSVSYFDE